MTSSIICVVAAALHMLFQTAQAMSLTAHAHYCFILTVCTLTGDINLVNGKPWPKLAVEQRTYRMHWLDAAISRDWSVKFIAETEDGSSQVNTLLYMYIDHT
jgi:FtsP/CotA-like multicopper oxidase with cupredoxin domain